MNSTLDGITSTSNMNKIFNVLGALSVVGLIFLGILGILSLIVAFPLVSIAVFLTILFIMGGTR